MTVRVRNSGAWQNVGSIFVRNGGSWASVQGGWIRQGGSWVKFFESGAGPGPGPEPGFSASIFPSEIVRYYLGPLTTLTTFEAATATPAGGSAPYTYSWTKVSGGNIFANSPSTQSTVFTADSMFPGEIRIADFSCTVTETSTGRTATTGIVMVTIEKDDGDVGGGGDVPPEAP